MRTSDGMIDPTDAVFADTPIRPTYDDEIVPFLEGMAGVVPPVRQETLEELRRFGAAMAPSDLTLGGSVDVAERSVPGPDGAPEIEVTILTPATGATALPAIYYIHGGGLVMGDRYQYLDQLAPYAARGEAVVVSVEYRLAPEHPAPAQVDDSYAGLVWLEENALELGVDPARIVVMGISAGGGLALGVALMARDRGLPAIKAQVLVAPMTDDRFEQPSSRMLTGVQTDRDDSLFMWDAALQGRRGGPDVSAYEAPARAGDYSGLPRTFIDTGGAEGFRDEVLSLAMCMSQDGVLVDAHLWGGGCHGFYFLAPDAAISKAARAAVDEFIARALR